MDVLEREDDVCAVFERFVIDAGREDGLAGFVQTGGHGDFDIRAFDDADSTCFDALISADAGDLDFSRAIILRRDDGNRAHDGLASLLGRRCGGW